MDALRRLNVPIQGTLITDKNRKFVSLTKALDEGEEVWAYSLRNADFSCALPEYTVLPCERPVTELIRPLQNPKHLGVVQYSRADAMQYIQNSVDQALDEYYRDSTQATLQVALSPGGDGRVLAECIRAYWNKRPSADFHCVIVAVGFEEENEHISNAIKIAEGFALPYTALGVNAAAEKLGYTTDLKTISEEYKHNFPHDEPEVMLTYWVQNLNFALARENGRRGIILGYNQEDVIADRLYQVMTSKPLGNFPIRRSADFDIIAPLCQIPKKMLDAMDFANSMRNYNIRSPSISYLRSSLYLLAYHIAEQFPALGDVISGAPLAAEDPDLVLRWLKTWMPQDTSSALESARLL
jgi:hypothetical protein